MKRCPVCKADALADQVVRTTLDYRGHVYILENVPAEVCGECGEVLLTASVAKDVERMVREGRPPHHAESVPVYDMGAAA